MPLEGLDGLAILLGQRIPDEVQDAAKAAIRLGCEELVTLMKSRVPVEQGVLRDSIDWTFGDAPEGSITLGEVRGVEFGQIRAVVYAGNEKTMVYNSRGIGFQNARIQQFGTRGGVPASDYFLGAWATLKKRIRSRITRETRKAIRRAYANG